MAAQLPRLFCCAAAPGIFQRGMNSEIRMAHFSGRWLVTVPGEIPFFFLPK